MSRQGLYVTKKAFFWAKMAVFRPNIGKGAKDLVPTYQKTTQAPRRFVFLVGHGKKWIKKANIWPKMAKKAYFGPSLAVFGPKILKQNFFEPAQRKTTLAPCSHCFLVVHVTKWAQIANIWPKMPIFGQIWPLLG